MSLIRQAVLQDAEAIQRIYNDEILHGTATFDTEILSDKGCLMQMEERMQHPFFVCEMEDQVIGFAGISPFNKKKAYDRTKEVTIYVDAKFQGRGFGDALFSQLIHAIKEENRVKTLISLITADNFGSIKLHEKHNFIYTGTLQNVGYKFDKYLDVKIYQLFF